MTGRIVEPQELQDGGDQSHAACGGDGRRAITAKRRAGGNLAANCENVGQRLVEIAHSYPGLCNTKYTRVQSKCKSIRQRAQTIDPLCAPPSGYRSRSRAARRCTRADSFVLNGAGSKLQRSVIDNLLHHEECSRLSNAG